MTDANRGFLWQPASATMTDISSLGGSSNVAYAIDDLGHIVGFSTTALNYPGISSRRAFLTSIDAGSMANLGTLSGKGTVANSITPLGDRRVIGHTVSSTHAVQNGFISAANGGPLSLLPKPVGTTYCQPYEINRYGAIVGVCDCQSNCRAYGVSDYGSGTPFLLAAGNDSGAYALN